MFVDRVASMVKIHCLSDPFKNTQKLKKLRDNSMTYIKLFVKVAVGGLQYYDMPASLCSIRCLLKHVFFVCSDFSNLQVPPEVFLGRQSAWPSNSHGPQAWEAWESTASTQGSSEGVCAMEIVSGPWESHRRGG